MAHSGTTITAPVQILGDLQPVLGTSYTGLGQIIAGKNSGGAYLVDINKWAKNKPVQYTSVAPLTYDQRRAASFGLTWDGAYLADSNFGYTRPTSYFRLRDFDGYDHNSSMRLGLRNTVAAATFTPDNMTSNISLQLTGGRNDASFIGLMDLKTTLFANWKKVTLQLTKPGGRSALIAQLTTIDLDNFADTGGGNFSYSYGQLAKFGRCGDTSGTADTFTLDALLTHNTGGTFLATNNPIRCVLSSNVGGALFRVWNTTSRQTSLRIGTSSTGSYNQTFDYYNSVIEGRVMVLDLTSATKFFFTTEAITGGSIDLNQGNIRLRITDWGSNKEGYVPLGSGESLDNFSFGTSGKTSGYVLGQNTSALPNLGQNIFGFSLVYISATGGYIPLTAEVFCNCKFPTTSYTPTNIL